MERKTKQRDIVEQALRKSDEFIAAQDLFSQIEAQGEHIGLATVYRHLNALADEGKADTLRMGGQQLFRLCGNDEHHHHLVCTVCGTTVKIDPPSEQWVRNIAQAHGFTVESHTLEVFGVCPTCQQRLKA